MMISRAEIQSVLRGYLQQVKEVDGKKGRVESVSEIKEARRDSLTISSQAQELQKYQDVLRSTPDVRDERVQALADQIASGQYEVDAEKVALQILARTLGDKLV